MLRVDESMALSKSHAKPLLPSYCSKATVTKLLQQSRRFVTFTNPKVNGEQKCSSPAVCQEKQQTKKLS